jgi:hypothetical protein
MKVLAGIIGLVLLALVAGVGSAHSCVHEAWDWAVTLTGAASVSKGSFVAPRDSYCQTLGLHDYASSDLPFTQVANPTPRDSSKKLSHAPTLESALQSTEILEGLRLSSPPGNGAGNGEDLLLVTSRRLL